MKFVFDTNVLISPCLNPGGLPAKALKVAERNGTLIFSLETKLEFEKVLLRDYFDKYIDKVKRRIFLKNILRTAQIKEPGTFEVHCRDESDIKFIQLAIIESADCIVSGDFDLLDLNPIEGVEILKPTEFLLKYS